VSALGSEIEWLEIFGSKEQLLVPKNSEEKGIYYQKLCRDFVEEEMQQFQVNVDV